MKLTGTYISAAVLAMTGLVSALPAPGAVSIEKRAWHGEGTVYEQKGNPGSCGQVHADSDLIVALSNVWMESQSPSKYCGRKIRAKNKDTGNEAILTVADTCPSAECPRENVDFSVGSWDKLTGAAPWGRFPLEWDFA